MNAAADPGSASSPQVTAVNGRTYARPVKPTVLICFDGCDPQYVEAASRAGMIPAIDRMRREGFSATALAAMPTFTNPNNVSIVCGAPPAVHGVSGNYYLDRASGREVMMLDAAPMRAQTILGALSEIGTSVAMITAKDKLRKALSLGVRDGISLSAERADKTTVAENGIAGILELVGRQHAPEAYSADLSLFVLDAGVALLARRAAELLYLSLSDYVQHKHAPDAPEALAFMAAVDGRIERLSADGAVVGIVADHGMSDMSTDAGPANVLYLGDHLDHAYGEGAAKVICPITDPFVRHHGALGGFVRVHLISERLDAAAAIEFIRTLPGVAVALSREEACKQFELPYEAEGDIAVVARKGVALGARAVDHDLRQLAGVRLRSHGGTAEQHVPFILSHPLTAEYHQLARARPLRNFDIFDFALNGITVTGGR
jgi:phosphonoacetate hydrolase